MRYSVPARDRIFLKGYEFLSLAKDMVKKIDRAKQSATDTFKSASKRSI